jgi:hypothetical protein
MTAAHAAYIPRHTHVLLTATHILPPTVVPSTSGRAFRHIRDLTGVIDLENTPSRKSYNPNLNNDANEYLWAHGYQVGIIQLIQQIFESSEGSASFTQRLIASGGISIAEAQYIYHLIRGEPLACNTA